MDGKEGAPGGLERMDSPILESKSALSFIKPHEGLQGGYPQKWQESG